MMEINLTQGKVAIIDDADFDLIKNIKWRAQKDKNTFYAVGSIYSKNTEKIISMHRYILQVSDSKILVDHKDRNGLNNTRANIRICTYSQNCQNKKSDENSTSKYLGVSFRINTSNVFNKKTKEIKTYTYRYFQAYIKPNSKSGNIYLGKFDDEVTAAKAYDKAAIKYFGEFANLNFK